MSTPMAEPNAAPAESQGRKAETNHDGGSASTDIPSDPSMPTPGAAEKGERICDAASDPHKPSGVESVDKGA